ncbi:hypothetical protein F5888DRAFT_1750833 [Russula emetica]|nr:hypothetical protein F5888DRAFT_1750833 [Russula emetica]
MFRSWHSQRQRGSASGRAPHRTTSSRPISHPEDAQPNESVDKRQRRPPAVNIVAAQQSPRRVGQGSSRNTQFVARESSRSMRSTGGVPTPPSNSAQPTSNYKWRLRNSGSTPSLTLPSEPPPPKRRKLECPPLVETKRGSLTGKIIPVSTSSVSPVSSETLVGEHRVKKERSISPELSSVERQLVTVGTKRYAPLPPECMKSQANYKAARSAWAKKVQEELKSLGLKVVRTFIRFAVPHLVLSCSHLSSS